MNDNKIRALLLRRTAQELYRQDAEALRWPNRNLARVAFGYMPEDEERLREWIAQAALHTDLALTLATDEETVRQLFFSEPDGPRCFGHLPDFRESQLEKLEAARRRIKIFQKHLPQGSVLEEELVVRVAFVLDERNDDRATGDLFGLARFADEVVVKLNEAQVKLSHAAKAVKDAEAARPPKIDLEAAVAGLNNHFRNR